MLKTFNILRLSQHLNVIHAASKTICSPFNQVSQAAPWHDQMEYNTPRKDVLTRPAAHLYITAGSHLRPAKNKIFRWSYEFGLYVFKSLVLQNHEHWLDISNMHCVRINKIHYQSKV